MTTFSTTIPVRFYIGRQQVLPDDQFVYSFKLYANKIQPHLHFLETIHRSRSLKFDIEHYDIERYNFHITQFIRFYDKIVGVYFNVTNALLQADMMLLLTRCQLICDKVYD